jgi:nucleotide-binding universal stress UspA family protein
MTMNGFRSILVDVDALAAVHPAMDRAVEVARACGARLKVVDVMAVPGDARGYLAQGIEEALLAPRRERLAALAAAAAGVTVEYDILRGRTSIELIREVLRSEHDLLIRSHARDLAAPRTFGAIDMQLFRQCPCPVWAVGPAATTAPRRVLAAVHATADDAEEQALNRKILNAALLLAGFGGSAVVVFQAWSAFGEDLLRNHATPDEVTAYVKAAFASAQTTLDDLVKSFGGRLGSARVELQKGDPEDLIPRFVVSEGIDLVVMGTVARTGIAGFVIGNTAERLLQRLVCSVFAVKPDGFRTHVRLDQ